MNEKFIIKTMILMFLLCFQVKFVLLNGLGIYHVGSKTTYRPDSGGEYFGFSVVALNGSVIVGAPKALSRQTVPVKSGLIFKCSKPEFLGSNITCSPLDIDKNLLGKVSDLKNKNGQIELYKDGMWFGAAIDTINDERIVACAPRYSKNYENAIITTSGFCYVSSTVNRPYILAPAIDKRRLYIKNNNKNFYFHAYAEVGLSLAVTKLDTLVFGAPGTLMWTGSFVEHIILDQDYGQRVFLNPYDTKDLGQDEYFGYSIESGDFDKSGELYVAGAPRSANGFGQVFIFKPPKLEHESLKIRALLRGSQLGSYFGASVRCSDLNGDGFLDLLVGAPNYVRKEKSFIYDQGAVFVYMNKGAVIPNKNNSETKDQQVFLQFEDPVIIMGSESSGARFGTVIADLGDIDGDRFNDIAIGAPNENNGQGAVYIYRGSKTGIKTNYIQRITAEYALGFGMAVARGYDFDDNNCNDLIVGAYESGTAYVFGCIPSLTLNTTIKVNENIEWNDNSTNFVALFCVNVADSRWPNLSIKLKASIIVDGKAKRAQVTDQDEYEITVEPSNELCEEKIIEVLATADLSKPIPLTFQLTPLYDLQEDSATLISSAARISEDSRLESIQYIQLISDCGSDLICKPLINMQIIPLETSVYVPGTNSKLGFKIIITNKAEPAFNTKINVKLPLLPKRLPESCILKDLNVTCDLPSPLKRNNNAVKEFELEFVQNNDFENEVLVQARVYNDFYSKDSFENAYEELKLKIKPEAVVTGSGRSLPNNSILISRYDIDKKIVSFVHYFMIINHGPSLLKNASCHINLQDEVELLQTPKECIKINNTLLCETYLLAKETFQLMLHLKVNLDNSKYGPELEAQGSINVTTILDVGHHRINVTTSLVLEPPTPLWPIFVGLVAGLLILAPLIYGLYKINFFTRDTKTKLKQLKEAGDLQVLADISNNDDDQNLINEVEISD